MCPVCAVAVGVGVGLSRYLGIDDTISGVWMGALILSLSFLSATWTKKYIKALNYWLGSFLYFALYLATTLFFFLKSGIIGHPANRIWGADKLVVGMGFGCVVFLLSLFIHGTLRFIHGRKVFFPFQKVIIPVAGLVSMSIVFYFLVR